VLTSRSSVSLSGALGLPASVTRLLSAVDAAEDPGAKFDVAYAVACIDGALARAADRPFAISAGSGTPKPCGADIEAAPAASISAISTISSANSARSPAVKLAGS
jgi:hypothetical protein